MEKDSIKAKKPLFYFIAAAVVVLLISLLVAKTEKANKQYIPEKAKDNTTVNKKDTIVSYELPATPNSAGQSIFMRVEYSDRTPNAKVLNVDLEPAQAKSDGEYDYFLISKNNEQIRVTFYYKNGSLENARLTTVSLPPEASAGGVTTYAVLSKDGQEILFQFHWMANADIDYVSVSPSVNPFVR